MRRHRYAVKLAGGGYLGDLDLLKRPRVRAYVVLKRRAYRIVEREDGKDGEIGTLRVELPGAS